MTQYDLLVVGSGLTGAVIAENAARQRDWRVLVIDERDHAGGNVHDRRNAHGVLYHPYGPHIFHTNAQVVVDYLSRFTGWRPYEHRVVAMVEGRLIPVPFNLDSLAILRPPAEAERLATRLVDTYGYGASVPIMKLREQPALADLAALIYETVFHGYTLKQWGLPPEALSPSVMARVPVRVSHDDRYFTDRFQSMPQDGYAAMLARMLDHPRISLSLNTPFAQVRGAVRARHIVYTGPIDAYFNHALGVLPFRSLRFDYQTLRQARHQPVAQVNYPVSHDFTRITEMGHLTGEWNGATTLAIEYPQAYRPGENLPFYPIPRDENDILLRRYRDLASEEAPDVTFCGRLGSYRYYNMDQAVAAALVEFERLAAR